MTESTDNTAGQQTGFRAQAPALLLMALVLVVAGLLSALPAMRIAVRGYEIDVPDLIGRTHAESAGLLAATGLDLELEGHRFSSDVAEGLILDQTPPAGMRLKPDRTVKILLSLGPRQFAVPEVEGLSLRATQLMLTQRGLSLGNTLYAHTDAGETASVVYQAPLAGDAAASDPAVNVLVSLGPINQYFVMPDLTGRPSAGTIRQIRDAGFRIGEVVLTPEAGVERGRIVGQSPPPGYRVSKNDIILLDVSQ